MKIDLGHYMLQLARRYGDKIAVTNAERERSFTFAELQKITNKICNMMVDQFGLSSGDKYMAWLKNDNMILAHFLLKGAVAGAWSNYRDSVEEHLAHVDLLKPSLILLENELIEKYYDELHSRNIVIVSMDPIDHAREGLFYLWDVLEDVSDAELGVEIEIDEDIVLYRFTGGTTGAGKCAMYTAGNLLAGMQQFYGQGDNLICEDEVFLGIAPLTHGSCPWPIPVFFKGGTFITQNQPDLETFGVNVAKYAVTSSVLVPTMLYRLLDQDIHNSFDLSSIRTMYYGAAPMSPDKLKELQGTFGDAFVQVYSATEAYPGLVFLGKKDHVMATDGGVGRLASVGVPAPGVEIRIRNDDGRDLPANEVGEVWARSRSVIKGYYKDPEQTASEFIDGYWKSGDLAYQDEEGYLYLVDRKKDMIITGGFNVYCSEVEAAINSHPEVVMSVVFGVADEQWGEAVHAEVVITTGSQLTEEALKTLCGQKISRIKVPKKIKLVSELPISSVGKILRREVRAKYMKQT